MLGVSVNRRVEVVITRSTHIASGIDVLDPVLHYPFYRRRVRAREGRTWWEGARYSRPPRTKTQYNGLTGEELGTVTKAPGLM